MYTQLGASASIKTQASIEWMRMLVLFLRCIKAALKDASYPTPIILGEIYAVNVRANHDLQVVDSVTAPSIVANFGQFSR